MKAFVTHYQHKHGDVYGVNLSRAEADAERASVARQGWTDLMIGPAPADDAEMANAYFEIASERIGEFFLIKEIEIDSPAMANPAPAVASNVQTFLDCSSGHLTPKTRDCGIM